MTGDKSHVSTPYSLLLKDLEGNGTLVKEQTLGKRISFYKLRGEIGMGNFSQVKLGVHLLTKEKVAIKILDKTKLDKKTQRLLSREISSMDKLRHRNIVRLYEVIDTLAKMHIVMEYAGEGELFTKVSEQGRLTEPTAKIIFSQIVSAVEHMHKMKVMHRDLKAENVFFARPYFVKVGDFGFSTISHTDQALNTFCGSPPYAAPELFQDDFYYGINVDIWALGILIYFMVTGIMPFRADTVGKLKKVILEGIYSIPAYVSTDCQQLIRRILRHNPSERSTIDQIKEHSWLENQNFGQELKPYRQNPSLDNLNDLSADEKEARNTLRELGVPDEHIEESQEKGTESHVTGTYRIILHTIQKRNSGEFSATNSPSAKRVSSSDNLSIYSLDSKENDLYDKQKSKFCTLL